MSQVLHNLTVDVSREADVIGALCITSSYFDVFSPGGTHRSEASHKHNSSLLGDATKERNPQRGEDVGDLSDRLKKIVNSRSLTNSGARYLGTH